MMDYEVFKDIVAEKFLSCMPEKYQDMEVKVTLVEKVNGKQYGLRLYKADGEESFSDDIYQRYVSVLFKIRESAGGSGASCKSNGQVDSAATRDSAVG